VPSNDTRSVRLAIDAVRVLAMDAVQAANSGHPGTPMALAPAGYVLWMRHLRHNPRNPGWLDRDRFVLSCGHASMLQYALLHLTGYDLGLDDIRAFRQWGSRTAGHPEYGHTPGVETTTGPLGQGLANSVGMALAERWLAARFNRPGHAVVNHHTYVFCSDGDLQEGVSHEAAELAGHQRLGKLIWLYDDNQITIDGSTNLTSSTDHLGRLESYGWHVQGVPDGNDVDGIDRALRAARGEESRPSLIKLRTTIAWGSPNKAGTAEAHGAPLGVEEVRLAKEALGYPSQEPFFVPEEAREVWGAAVARGTRLEAEWVEKMEALRSMDPALVEELERWLAGALPENWEEAIQSFTPPGKPEATRSSSGRVIQALGRAIPNLIGGSADLAGSNKTDIDGGGSLLSGSPTGRNIHFGVREHSMGGILNGIALHGGLKVFGGTFLIFSDYMRPAIRLAALMGLPVRYVFTHDSIGLGEDGPTHQPIEHLMALRAIPNLMDLRPADGLETAEAWRLALERTNGPAFLALTRQNVPQIDRARAAAASDVRRGGYILREAASGRPQVILLASGSEVHLAVQAATTLEGEGIPTRVVSLMSWYLFTGQDADYRERVLPPDVTARVSVEAGNTVGWERWVGGSGRSVGIDRFGASAPYDRLYREFRITSDAVVAAARDVVG
jgi:transketolase